MLLDFLSQLTYFVILDVFGHLCSYSLNLHKHIILQLLLPFEMALKSHPSLLLSCFFPESSPLALHTVALSSLAPFLPWFFLSTFFYPNNMWGVGSPSNHPLPLWGEAHFSSNRWLKRQIFWISVYSLFGFEDTLKVVRFLLSAVLKGLLQDFLNSIFCSALRVIFLKSGFTYFTNVWWLIFLPNTGLAAGVRKRNSKVFASKH